MKAKQENINARAQPITFNEPKKGTFIKSGKDRVPEAASSVNDKESLSKDATDLTK